MECMHIFKAEQKKFKKTLSKQELRELKELNKRNKERENMKKSMKDKNENRMTTVLSKEAQIQEE